MFVEVHHAERIADIQLDLLGQVRKTYLRMIEYKIAQDDDIESTSGFMRLRISYALKERLHRLSPDVTLQHEVN